MFLRLLGIALAVTALVFSNTPARASSHLGVVILEKCQDADRASLEKLLTPATAASGMPAGKINLADYPHVTSRTHFPQIIYTVTEADEEGRSSFSAGESLILNKKGFFITAYHCVKLSLGVGEPPGVVLIYGPTRNVILTGRILAYSKEADLALGRVMMPADLDFMPLTIAQGPVRPRQVYFNKRYANPAYFSRNLLPRILKLARGFLADDRAESGNWMRTAEEEAEGLEYEVTLGRAVRVEAGGESLLGPEPGRYFLMTGQRGTENGHSGSPVFGLDGSLAGVVVSIPQKKGLFRNSKGETVRLAYFSGPENLRNLIKGYLR
jgi:hypothetical protein